jgi:hypothetical protein
MMVIMFDPHFKNMKIIWDFMGNWFVVQIVAKYNTNMLYLLLLQMFLNLNPNKTLAEIEVVGTMTCFLGRLCQMVMLLSPHCKMYAWWVWWTLQKMWLNVWHQRLVWLNNTRKCWNNMICIESWYNLNFWFIFLILNYVQHFFCFFPFFFHFFLVFDLNVLFFWCLQVGWRDVVMLVLNASMML